MTHIERLAKLKEQGLLTDEEFAASKARALGTSAPVLAAPAAEESEDLPGGEPDDR